jgi:hypothetical protein
MIGMMMFNKKCIAGVPSLLNYLHTFVYFRNVFRSIGHRQAILRLFSA